MQIHRGGLWEFLLLPFLSLIMVITSASGQTQPRIAETVDEARRVSLKGNVHPLARAEFDRGSAPFDLLMERMLLVLKRSQEQESELQKLLDNQQDKASPRYHQWLTPEQFAQQFGPADDDLQTLTEWLKKHGFHDIRVTRGRTVIEFSGNVGQVQEALGTSIRQFVVNGEGHWANANDPTIPASLSPVVAGIVSLHNFPRKPLHHVLGVFSAGRGRGSHQLIRTTGGGMELWTGGGNCGLFGTVCYALGPFDFASIYNVLPLWNATPAIDGTGQTIAIVGQSDIYPSDVSDFRAAFGLPAPILNIIHNGPDPGNLATSGDETESDLDVEWAGAVARGATIDFVVSGSTNSSAGVDLSALYVVDNDLAPIMSESYGECELGLGTAGNLFYSQLWQQAAAEGITVFVAAGDSGSAGCDAQSSSAAMYGLAVSGISSTPYNVAVGGTDFNDLQNPTTYWNSSNAPTTQATAKSYIPEMTWNDSCTNSELFQFGTSTTPEGDCNDTKNPLWPAFLVPVGGGGGVSNCTTSSGQVVSSCSAGYPKPSWQNGTGVPNDGKRDVPDVSLFAGDGLNANFYLICESDFYGGCSSGSNFVAIGGTSAPTPSLAGIMAMVNQKTQSRQGNANYHFYPLAAITGASCVSSAGPASSCVFYDVTTGTNAMPCVSGGPNCVTNTSGDQAGVLSGYNAVTGYDLATGLGSVNAANLVNNWPSAVFQPTATTLTLNGGSTVNVTHGTAVNVSVTVKPQSGNGTPAGLVSLLTSRPQGVTDFTLVNGAVSSPTGLLPGGSYTATAHYAGDGTFAASNSSPGVAVTVNAEPSSTAVQVFTIDQNGTSVPFTTGSFGGSVVYVRANVAGQSGQGFPTGTVTLADTSNGTPITFSGNPYPLNSEGYTITPLPGGYYQYITPGTHSIVASYSGDASFNANTSPATSFTITKAQTTTATNMPICVPSPNQCSTFLGSQVTIFGTVSANNSPGSNQPTGTIAFYSNGVALSSPLPVDSSIIPPVASLTTNQLPLGLNNITAQYSGDTNYLSSGSVANAVDVDLPTNLNLTVSSTTFQLGQSITFTAQVAPTRNGGPAPTGTVQFTANGVVLGNPAINGSGQAQVTTNSLPGGSFTVFATHSGDQDYQTSSNSVLMTGTGFVLSVAPVSATITISKPGGSGTATLTVTAATGFNGTVNFSMTCPGVSVEITCGINPGSVSLAGKTTGSATLTVTTMASSILFPNNKPTAFRRYGHEGKIVAACILWIVILLLSVHLPQRQRSIVFSFLLVISVVGWEGCGGGGGGGGGGSMPQPGTPKGTYIVVVTASSGTETNTATLSFVVQ